MPFTDGSSHNVKVVTGLTVGYAYLVITLGSQHHLSFLSTRGFIQSTMISIHPLQHITAGRFDYQAAYFNIPSVPDAQSLQP